MLHNNDKYLSLKHLPCCHFEGLKFEHGSTGSSDQSLKAEIKTPLQTGEHSILSKLIQIVYRVQYLVVVRLSCFFNTSSRVFFGLGTALNSRSTVQELIWDVVPPKIISPLTDIHIWTTESFFLMQHLHTVIVFENYTYVTHRGLISCNSYFSTRLSAIPRIGLNIS